MIRNRVLGAALATTLAVTTPASIAHAQERALAVPTFLDVEAQARDALTTSASVLRAPLARHGWSDPAPAEIRLSSGAKTAIIIGAIIGGILIIAGVVVLAKPGKPGKL